MAEDSLETSAPDAAAAPAPATEEGAAAAVAAPEEPTGTSDAIAEARQRLADGDPIVEDPAPPAGEGESADEPTGDEPPPAEGEDPPPEPTPEEAADADAAAAAAEDPPPEVFVVTLRGLENRGEDQIEVEVADQETYERLSRINNGYMTAQQIKTGQDDNAKKATDLLEVEDAIAIDPTGFVLEHIPEQLRSEIAMQLLFEPVVLNQIRENLAAGENPTSLAEILESPDALRITQAELGKARLELRETLRSHNEDQRAMRANGEAIATEIQSLIPDEITGAKRNLLFGDAVRDVKDRCDRLGLKKLDVQDVKLIVSGRFREQGIEFAQPRANGDGQPSRAPAPSKPAAAAPARTGAAFVKARTTRVAAAASAPAGAGAPAASPRPELPPTTDERLAMARKFGLRHMLGKT